MEWARKKHGQNIKGGENYTTFEKKAKQDNTKDSGKKVLRNSNDCLPEEYYGDDDDPIKMANLVKMDRREGKKAKSTLSKTS